MSESTKSRANNDRSVLIILLLQLPVMWVSGVLGAGLFWLSFIGSLTLTGVGVLSYVALRGHWLLSVIFAILMMSFSALLIQSQLGMLEMHFHIFALMSVFLIYEDWRPIMAALATVALHHISFTAWQLAGVDLAGVPLMAFAIKCSWGITLLHAAFAAAEAFILSALSIQLRRRSEADQAVVDIVEDVARNRTLKTRQLKTNSASEQAMHDLIASFNQIFLGLRARADGLSSLSESLDRVSANAGSISEHQYQQTSDIAQSTQEMLASIAEVEANSTKSAELMETLNGEVSVASKNMQSIVGSIQHLETDMSGLSESLRQVTDDTHAVGAIVESITAISEQTNLLALNAAIEAARAGESGRGFAVVADEVRTLAGRAKSSAAGISDLIDRLNASVSKTVAAMAKNQKDLAGGSERIAKEGDRLHYIADDALKVNAMFQAIAHAIEAQRQVMEHIGAKASLINDDGRRLSDLSNQLVKESSELRDHVAENRKAVESFTV
ncbi:methyl-accepting chemotaxis protein [Gilvimarinus chinensis]|uniref:methyl-accepting chemotaxis protein n=1 Tax=Gilvimarinus chinensis TaxID=396005 RepID=UPI0003804B24|nr:methyl-accepting chemotaxis protein [Gilvimarinus chinensis]